MSTILVVEDSRTQRCIISQWLASKNFTVTSAKDGVEAIQKIKKERPDAIILDIIMPKLNGYELCRKLKSHPATKDIQVILCSSKSTEIDRYWGLKQGADAYLVKPFKAHELISTVQHLLNLEQE